MTSLRIRADDREIIAGEERALTIGRDAGADVTCTDERVSRKHLLVRRDSTGWTVEDSGSLNGTYLDGERIQKLRVDRAVRLLLGDPVDGVPIDFEPLSDAGVTTFAGAVVEAPTAFAEVPRQQQSGPPPLRVRALGRDFTLSGDDALTIGRDSGCSLRVDDPRVSRLHAVVRRDQNGWFVEDVGSTNGTFAEGRRVAQLRVEGDVSLLLGDAQDGVRLDLVPLVAQVPTAREAGLRTATHPESDVGRVTMLHSLSQVVRIGRSSDNDVVINDFLVSRHHAELRSDAGQGWRLIDLNSHNGTFVNGQRVISAPLSEGDIVTLGRQHLRLRGGTLEEYTETGKIGFAADGITQRSPEGRVLLDSVSFALEPSSFLAVVGTSGAGKSTLLNALAGFRPAASGRVLCGGRDLYAWYDELRQRIGYVPQDDILHRQLTVRRALQYSAELRYPPDVSTADRDRRIDEVMAELGLTQRADLAIEKLSGGQRKRVSIALELLTKPDLLFLDEPTSGLDPGMEKSLMSLLRELADGGRTVIVITHSLQSLKLCNRVLFMAPGGKVAFFGPPDEALAFFGRDDFADVFSDLETRQDLDWKGQFQASGIAERFVRRPLAASPDTAAGPGPPPPHHSWTRQFSTLVRRYVAVIASDRVNRVLLIVQAPFLALIIFAALGSGSFDVSNATALRGAQLTALFLVTGITFLAAGNAIREIVKEFPIYQRERSVGLSISAYVASKVVVLAVITVLQAAVLVLVAAARQGGPAHGAALPGPMRLELIVDMALAGIAALGLGLLVSAIVKSADKALTLLPLLLVPQQVLSNPLLQIETKPVLSQLAPVSSARWGYAISGSTIDLNALTAVANSQLPPGADKADLQGFYNHDSRTWLIDAGWLVLLFGIEVVATGYALRRRDPTLLGSPVPRAGQVAPQPVIAIQGAQ